MNPSERIAELEEEVHQLRHMLKVQPDFQTVAQLQGALTLPNHEAIILATLYGAGSTWLTAERLDMALPQRLGSDLRDMRTIQVRISQIRKRLGSDAIIGRYKAGYTPRGIWRAGPPARPRARGASMTPSQDYPKAHEVVSAFATETVAGGDLSPAPTFAGEESRIARLAAFRHSQITAQ